MEVGPSAAPMMAMEAASRSSKPNRLAIDNVKKMPNCAAAPKSSSFGSGQQRAEIDHRADADEQQQREQLVRHARAETARLQHASDLRPGVRQVAPGSQPKPIGSSSVGSISLQMAR